MLHDFEEIIFFRRFLDQYGDRISARFPRLRLILDKANAITTPSFTFVVAEEFVLVSLISFSAVYSQHYGLWIAAFMAFFLHLFIHLGQCALFASYVPGVVTSFMLIPACVYVFMQVINAIGYTYAEIVGLAVVGVIVMIVNVVFMHYLASRLKI